MVVIDEKDINKSKEEILMDLIYESTGQRIPLPHVRFGKPQELDQRPDLKFDPNTFIGARVNPRYDNRYNAAGSGFMYRRRSIIDHMRGCVFEGITPTHLPFKVSDLLPQINHCLPYPIAAEEIVDYEYTTLDEVKDSIKLKAHPESLLWCDGGRIPIDDRIIAGQPLLTVTNLPGFYVWTPPAEPVAP